MAGKAGQRPPIGVATLKRTAITNTILREEGLGRGRDLLAQVSGIVSGRLKDTPLAKILYSKDTQPSAGFFHTKDTLRPAINSAFTHVKDFAGLLEATGRVHFIDRVEARSILEQATAEAAIDRVAHGNYERVASPNFRSSHFDEPNILAHIRFNERIDADGRKVLFIEEIQSDWHQTARKQGFMDKITLKNCAFALQCRQKWDHLEETANSGTRYCTSCESLVYLCLDEAQLQMHIEAKHCIAVRDPSTNSHWLGGAPASYESAEKLDWSD